MFYHNSITSKKKKYNSIILQNLNLMQKNKIQKFQNTCARFILNLRKFDHISAGINSLGFLKMENSRNLQALTLMHKIVKKEAPIYLIENIQYNNEVHRHETRAGRNIHLVNSKTNFGKNRFLNFTGNEYNKISNELNITENMSVNSFRQTIKNIS